MEGSFDSEAKLSTIVAFGDLVLAAGPVHFMQYLPETQTSFIEASKMSLNKGSSAEEIELLGSLRIALCEAYVSILHGLQPDEGELAMNQSMMIEQFAL